ncbi:molybdopterin-synthase adenylyltransferase MoeB [Flavobacterium myungsuense]|uniref:Molybdopterin-synthase adenylyltransferase MoeB n=1 Tax=Flavobacterium myungsuense TaxID=651823 RepID=A0ABW3IZW8_9FLAO
MEKTRYNRQIILPEVGDIGQQKLLDAKVLIVGIGGLGTAVLPYLTAAGVGEIGVIDDDTIELTNLQRQVIYKNNSIGKSKALEAKEMALALNPSVKVNAITEKLNSKNAISLFEYYDIIVDGTDNIKTKYLINNACSKTNKPFVYGSVYKFEGQVSVFNYQNGPTYKCLFPQESNEVSNCNEAGVLGVSVGIIGMFQANEVLKMILGIGEILSGKLLVYNFLNNEQHKFDILKSDSTIHKASFHYKYSEIESASIEIEVSKALIQINNPEVVFVDVRNEDEYPKLKINNCIQIPLKQLEFELHKLNTETTFFVFCQSGVRSKNAVEILRKNNFNRAQSIVGGANAIEKMINNESVSAF